MTPLMQTTQLTVEQVARQVVGKTDREAYAFIKEAGFVPFAVVVDGAGIPGCREYLDCRVKLWVVNNVVTRTAVG